jgi:hypothetical protein
MVSFVQHMKVLNWKLFSSIAASKKYIFQACYYQYNIYTNGYKHSFAKKVAKWN